MMMLLTAADAFHAAITATFAYAMLLMPLR